MVSLIIFTLIKHNIINNKDILYDTIVFLEKLDIIKSIGGSRMDFNIIETFSGIGSQAKAFSRLQNKIPDYNFHIRATVEWEIGAMFAYDILHHGPQDLTLYDKLSKEELIAKLTRYNLSSDGKQPIKKSTLKRMPIKQLKAIFHSIENNNNLVDISTVKATDLPDADLLTYSFPCQDLSISSYWHNNFSGIDKNAKNRSGLLWEIERILNEYQVANKPLPRFLLMENVSAIHGPLHEKNFKLWRNELKRLGYKSKYYDLDSSDFGIPQSRLRTFMISVYTGDLHQSQIDSIIRFLDDNVLEEVNGKPSIDSFLRLDYSNPKYFKEALASTPNDTPSRRKIALGSTPLAYGNMPTKNIAKTITTKQDRFPNAGIIFHNYNFGEEKSLYRNLTPRETFLLMGFDESDYQLLIDNNLTLSKSRKMLSHAKLLKLAGNSIVVNVLEEIFKGLIHIDKKIINKSPNLLFFNDINERKESYH